MKGASAMTELHRCAACTSKGPVVFTIFNIRPIYYGYVYTRQCPSGHVVTEHRK